MKKTVVLMLSVLMLVSCFGTFVPAAFSASDTDENLIFSFNYADVCGGVVNGKKTAITEKVEEIGVSALKINANSEEALENQIRLDTFSLSYPAKKLKQVKYIVVDYRYISANPDPNEMLGRMKLDILKSGGCLEKDLKLDSKTNIAAGAWKKMVFDVSVLDELVLDADGNIFKQFHFRPFGTLDPTTMTYDQTMYIGNFYFYSELPEDIKAELEAASANQYPGGVVFSFDYKDAYCEIVNGKKTAVVEKVTEDGREVIKVKANPEEALDTVMRLDAYKLDYSADMFKDARYVTVEYKYECATPGARLGRMKLDILKSGGCLEKDLKLDSKVNIMADGWQTAVFDISTVKDLAVVKPGNIFKQFHFQPFGTLNPKNMTDDQVMYIGKFTFYTELPEDVKTAMEIAAANQYQNGFITSFDYADAYCEIVNGKKTAVVEKVTEDGISALMVRANQAEALDSTINLDAYQLNYSSDVVKDIRYISVKYKYVCNTPGSTLSKMEMTLLSRGGALKSDAKFTSINNIISGEWQTAIFDASRIKDLVVDKTGNILRHIQFRPFGTLNPKSMTDDQVMYIGEFGFHTENPDKDMKYTVSFRKGRDEAQGADPAPIMVKSGEKYTLPEPGYTITDVISYNFLGWKCSLDNQLYSAGTEMTGSDASVTYSATYSVEKSYFDFRRLKYVDYQNGNVASPHNSIIENTVFQGMDVVKVTALPESETKDKIISIDGYNYSSSGVDLDLYKYMAVVYYFDGTLPRETSMRGVIYPTSASVLTKSYSFGSTNKMEAGKWAFAFFDMTSIDAVLNPDADSHLLRQMHIYPYGNMGNNVFAKDFTGDESLYISDILFFEQKPDLVFHDSYMKGYDGGLFMPQSTMTRAEAATIVARLCAGGDELVPTDKVSAFADVTSDKWYHKYISYVESLGYLGAYSGSFLPDIPITRAEFVELVYNMGLLQDAGKNGTFTDVDASHPRATVISAAGKAGLVNGYANGDGTFSFRPDATITRAEVVKVINNAYKRSVTKEQLADNIEAFFTDVPEDFWAYPDIAEATVSHIDSTKQWILTTVSTLDMFGNKAVDYAAGESYIAELDKVTDKRIEEIRNTSTSVNVTGTKYYISPNGNDSADGKSPETAWKTVEKLINSSSLLRAGDGVFFERGGIWRERISTTIPGVTYSAYGEGEKPTLYGSPENGASAEKWSLLEGTTNIWVYHKTLRDVGGIVLNDGEAVGFKAIPDLIDGKFFVRGTKGATAFDITDGLSGDLFFFSDIPGYTKNKSAEGKLYFRCDKGNPGEIYSSLEFLTNGTIISVSSNENVTVDNLRIMYGGSHGIGASTVKGLTVTNCEIGWIGGTLHTYRSDGTAVRLGNGVEIYGGCDGYTVDNCYIYEIYDAGVTHQYSGGTEDMSMNNIAYTNNVFDKCIYSIEYWLRESEGGVVAVRDGKNYLVEGNIFRRAGYGWGNQRPDSNVSSHMKGSNSRNQYEKGTFIIRNNIFDRAGWYLFETTCSNHAWAPIFEGNTFVQVIDRGLGFYKEFTMKHDSHAETYIKNNVGDASAKVYFLSEDFAPGY